MFDFLQKPDLPDGFDYIMPVISVDKAWSLYEHLRDQLSWTQPQIKVYGKWHAIPRLQCYIADSGLNYQYSELNLMPEPWLAPLSAMRARLETQFGRSFNALLLNYYRNGFDTMGWHADDEPELGESPTIISVSLGAARKFSIKHRRTKEVWNVMLEHGSALIMSGTSQRDYVHCLPKQSKVADGRINLTFRCIAHPPSV
ncbi:putative 2OG-Fe(II) oxygenase superfamily protein [Pseudoalteromonas luteoviolacea B = ATCC 29581]|nr:putative 2OG-Fe(II) oxygenase superfamily protein [Pseudoalteromonas luteoviolacea B = ATCC 29581]